MPGKLNNVDLADRHNRDLPLFLIHEPDIVDQAITGNQLTPTATVGFIDYLSCSPPSFLQTIRSQYPTFGAGPLARKCQSMFYPCQKLVLQRFNQASGVAHERRKTLSKRRNVVPLDYDICECLFSSNIEA